MIPAILLLAACSDFFLGDEPNLVLPRDTSAPGCACEGSDCPCSTARDDENGRWYLFSWPMALTWADARVFCRDRPDGDLAVLASEGEPERVFATASDRYEVDDPWWLGLTDTAAEGTWTWVDDTPLAPDAPWADGEPSDLEQVDCAALRLTATGMAWEDDDCDVPAYFVCEGPL